MDLLKHKKAIKEVVDSFLKMCDYIEKTDKNGCYKCPVFRNCFYKNKHDGLSDLMNELGIPRKTILL